MLTNTQQSVVAVIGGSVVVNDDFNGGIVTKGVINFHSRGVILTRKLGLSSDKRDEGTRGNQSLRLLSGAACGRCRRLSIVNQVEEVCLLENAQDDCCHLGWHPAYHKRRDAFEQFPAAGGKGYILHQGPVRVSRRPLLIGNVISGEIEERHNLVDQLDLGSRFFPLVGLSGHFLVDGRFLLVVLFRNVVGIVIVQ